jgi:hypothetical protein
MRKKIQRNEQILDLALRGDITHDEIAVQFGITRQRVSRIVRDAGVSGMQIRSLRLHDNGHGYLRGTGKVLQHVAIAERVMGKPLPAQAEVHHVNGVRNDNRNQNLVICEDHAYHMLLHVRQRALDACGNPNYRKCSYCGEWDDSENLTVAGASQRHRTCHNAHMRERYRLRRTALTGSA